MSQVQKLTPSEQRAVNMLSEGPRTARDAGVSTAMMNGLAASGFVQRAGVQPQTDEDGRKLRGRPSYTFKLTRKGKNRVAAKVVKAEPVAA
jgi:predicted ArsR family transcriptional regulator